MRILENELNNELVLDLRHKKEFIRKWKLGQIIKDEDKIGMDKIRKVKAHKRSN